MASVAVALFACSAGTIDGDQKHGRESAFGESKDGLRDGSGGKDKDGEDVLGPEIPNVDRDEACEPNALEPALVRRLSHQEYRRTVADLFPGVEIPAQAFASDLRVLNFENNAQALNASPVLVEQYSASAAAVAEAAAAQAETFLPCKPDGNDAACAKQALEALGKRIFRRPLTSEELSRYTQLFEAQMREISWNGALELTLAAMLQSPQFLYRVELGGGDADAGQVPLDDYELASRLSYLLWQSMPDDELLSAAEAGELRTQEQVEAQARRMLEDPRAEAALADFNRQWLDFDRLLTQNKDNVIYPAWNDSLRESMAKESELFVKHVFGKDGSGTIAELLTSTTSFVDDELAALYGVADQGGGDEHVLAELPPERAGILSRGTFLASQAHSTNGSPPLRGVAVLDALLCDKPPPPPPSANTATPVGDPNAPKTNRELFEERTAPAGCQGCHKSINGLGFGFEAFDSIGHFRTEDNGKPVDASGELFGTDVDGKFDGVADLAQTLSQSRQVQYCVVRNFYRYAHGRQEQPDEWCKLDRLNAVLDDNGGDVRELLVAIATSHEFMMRPEVNP